MQPRPRTRALVLACSLLACSGDADGPGVHGGLVGAEPAPRRPLPGLQIPEPGPCEHAVAHVRGLLHAAGVRRAADGDATVARDAVLGMCDDPAALACVRAAAAPSDLAACVVPLPPTRDGCEQIRRHYVGLMLVALRSEPGEPVVVANIAAFARPEAWQARCGRSGVPDAAVACVLAAADLDAFMTCGL